MSATVLIVDDEPNIRLGGERILRDIGFKVFTAETGERGLEILRKEHVHIMLLDLKMPGMGGMQVLRTIAKSFPDLIVIVITGYATIETAVEAGKLGAYDFVLKPFLPNQLRVAVSRAAEKLRLDKQQRNLAEEQLKNLRDMLRHQANFLANVIDASVDGIICCDMEGRILVYNRGAERILGFAEGEAVGKTAAELFYPPGMDQKIRAMIRSPEHGGPGRLTSFLVEPRRKDGSVVHCNLSAAIVTDDKGAEVGTVTVLVDLTERLLMEERLRSAQENLVQSEKLAAMGRLTSQIAHEINNPLFGILNTLELLKPLAEPGTRRRRILEIALAEGQRLADLLRKMLVLSKPEQEPHQAVDLNELIADLLIFVDRQMRERSIHIEQTFDPSLPEILASPAQLRQVFLNILRNARDAMPTGGVLSVSTKHIDENAIEVRISDTGAGIRDEQLGRIFDAFYTTKDKLKGVGLGLSVCYTAIKAHGGDIRVESDVGKGSTFIVTLPC